MAFIAYFDASGDVANSAKVISGHVARVEDWERFDADWRLVLAHDNVPYFHMKEFAHFKGPFKNWKGQDTRRANFLARLVSVIRGNLRCRVTSIVPTKEWCEVDSEYMLTEGVDGIYALAARTCARKAKEWVDEKYPGEPIRFVFEDGDSDANEGILRARFKGSGYAIPWFEPKKDPQTGMWSTPFQAADFAAYEFLRFTRWADMNLIRSLADIRRSFLNLYAMSDKRDGIYKKADLVKMCKRAQVPLRTGRDEQ